MKTKKKEEIVLDEKRSTIKLTGQFHTGMYDINATEVGHGYYTLIERRLLVFVKEIK